MLGAVGDFFGVVGVRIRIFEHAGEKFRAEHACNGRVDRGFGDFAGFHLVDERAVASGEREFDVDAGFERHARGVFLIRDDVMNGAEFVAGRNSRT